MIQLDRFKMSKLIPKITLNTYLCRGKWHLPLDIIEVIRLKTASIKNAKIPPLSTAYSQPTFHKEYPVIFLIK
jgi:hypothetical protein